MLSLLKSYPSLGFRLGGIIKVGQPVTQLPPHIPRRAELPHRVPQSYSLMRLH